MNETTQGPDRVIAATDHHGLVATRPWAHDAAAIAVELETDLSRGLSVAEAAERLTRVGPNELVIRKQKRPRRTPLERLTGVTVVGTSIGLIMAMLVAEL